MMVGGVDVLFFSFLDNNLEIVNIKMIASWKYVFQRMPGLQILYMRG